MIAEKMWVFGLLLIATVTCQWTFEPNPPILRVPFRVTTTMQISSVFLADGSSCSASVAGGSSTLLSGGSAVFQVTAVNKSQLFICNAQTFVSLTAVPLQTITFSPLYAIRTVQTTVSFPQFTPTGIISMRLYSDCSGAAASQQTLSLSNAIDVTMTSSGFYFACLTFFSTVTSTTVTINTGQFVVADTSSFTPQVVVTNQHAEFEVSGAAPPTASVLLSSSTNCSQVSQGPLRASGSFGKTVSALVALSRGFYTFCIEVPLNSNVYIPSGTLQVQQYFVVPQNLYAGVLTTFSGFFDSSKVNLPMAISSSSNCASPFLFASTPIDGQVNWTLSAVGVYYSCVFHSPTQTFILASQHNVTSFPTVQQTLEGIRSFPIRFSSSASQLVLGPSVANPVLSLITDASVAVGIIPATSPSVLTVWVPTLDQQYWYRFQDIPVRSAVFQYDALFDRETTSFVLDHGVISGFEVMFANNPSCTNGIVRVSPFSTVELPLETKVLCVNGSTFGFRPVWPLEVFSIPSASPLSILANRPFPISIFGVPTGFNIFVGSACSNSSAVAQSSGSPTLVVVNISSSVAVCVSYPGSQARATVRRVATVVSHGVLHSPTVQVVNTFSTYVVTCSDASLLVNQRFAIASDCNFVSQSVPLEQKNNAFVASIIPTQVGANLHACVGNQANGFTSAGSTRIVAPFTLAQDFGLVNIPFRITVSGSIFAPSLFLVVNEPRCNSTVVTSGTLDAAGTSTVRLTANVSHYVCVIADDGATPLFVGEIFVGSFSAVTTTLLRQRANILSVTNLLPNATVFLARERCEGTLFVASPVLTAPPGFYYLCQVVGSHASPSSNQVLVINEFFVQAPIVVRSFVPFDVEIFGGDLEFRSSFTVYLTLSNCTSAPLVTFTSFNATSATIRIPTYQYIQSVLCIRSADTFVTQYLTTFSPFPYMFPYTVVTTIPMTVTSGSLTTGFAVISPNQNCSFSWMAPVAVNSGSFFVPATSLSSGYYCESADGVNFSPRGVLGVVNLETPSGNQVGLINRTYAPSQPVVYSVDSSFAVDPFFSVDRLCTNQVDLSRGYVPAEKEFAAFFVCVLTVDRTLRFTTPNPTVRILNYEIFPRAFALSSLPQQFSLNFSVDADTNVFVSSRPNCSNSVAAVVLSPSPTITQFLTVVDGICFVCMERRSTLVNVASLLVSKAYTVGRQTLGIVSLPVCFVLSPQSQTYSLVAGAESSSTFDAFRGFYRSSNRSVFFSLSDASCRSGEAAAPSIDVLNESNVCLNTVLLQPRTYFLCTGSPAGFVSVASVSLRSLTVTPSVLVSGSNATITVVGAPFSSFVVGDENCAPASILFTTNASGIAPLTVSSLTNHFLPVGIYTVCQLGPTNTWTPISTVTVSAAQYYSVSNSRFLRNVATRVDLLQDFTSDRILHVSASASCNTVDRTFLIAILDTVTVQVTPSVSGVYYFCAVTPINNTVVVVSHFAVVNQFVQFATQVATCTDNPVALHPSASSFTVSLIDSPSCCSVFPATTVTTGVSSAAGVQVVFLTDIALETFAPNTTFSVCARNSSSCFHLGSMSFVSSACSITPIPVTPIPGDSQNGNSSSFTRQDLLNAPSSSSSKEISTTIILAAVFVALLVIIVIVVIFQCCLRSRRVVPADVESGKNGVEKNEWKRTFDSLVNNNPRSLATAVNQHQILHVPISMQLETCREAPIAMQRLELAERDERRLLEQIERNTFAQLATNLALEAQELWDILAHVEKSRVAESVYQLLYSQYQLLFDGEDGSRLEIVDEEGQARIQLVDMEKQDWRINMDLEGQRLRDALERDPFWKSRRKLLREAQIRAMQSVQASPAHVEPSPSHTLMVDQSELMSRYSVNKSADLWY